MPSGLWVGLAALTQDRDDDEQNQLAHAHADRQNHNLCLRPLTQQARTPLKNLLAFALPALAGPVFANSTGTMNPDVWIGARPALKVSVAAEASDTVRVNATVRDLRNGKLLSEPVLVVKAGAPARVELGTTGHPAAVLVGFTITVAANGESASYMSEISSNDEVIATQEATLVVSR